MKNLFLLLILTSAEAFAFSPQQIDACSKTVQSRAKNIVLATVGAARIDFENPQGDLKYDVKGNTLYVTSTFEYMNTISTIFTVQSVVIIDDPVDGTGINCATQQAQVKVENID